MAEEEYSECSRLDMFDNVDEGISAQSSFQRIDTKVKQYVV